MEKVLNRELRLLVQKEVGGRDALLDAAREVGLPCCPWAARVRWYARCRHDSLSDVRSRSIPASNEGTGPAIAPILPVTPPIVFRCGPSPPQIVPGDVDVTGEATLHEETPCDLNDPFDVFF